MRKSLPGGLDGVTQDWKVTSAGGAETFLVVASRTRLNVLEEELAGYEAARTGRAVADPSGGSESSTLRGIGGLAAASETADDAVSRLQRVFRELRSRRQHDGSVWVERYGLLNPGQ